MFKKITLFSILLATSIYGQNAAAEGSRQSAKPIVPKGWEGAYNNWGYAPALKVGDYIHISGVVFRLVGEGTYEERYARGFEKAIKQIEGILKEAGSSLDDVIELTSFHTDLHKQIETAVKTRMKLMNKPHPAWTAVGTPALADPEAVTEIKVRAYVG